MKGAEADAVAEIEPASTAAADPVAGTALVTAIETESATGTEPEPATTPVPGFPSFRRFWFGYTVSQFGDRVTELALPLIASGPLHASPFAAAALAAVAWTPNLLGVLLGAWVDRRRRKRRLMIAADLVRAAVLLSLPVAAAFHGVTLAQLYLVAVLCGGAAVLFNTSYPTFFAHLVPRSAYVAANSRLATSRSASSMVGPAAGGTLIAAVSAPWAVLADAVSFLVSAVTIGRVKVPEPQPEAAEVSVAGRAKEGIAYIAGQPILRATLACAATVNFFTFVANSSLLVLFMTRVLHLSGAAIGLALGVGASGALFGAVLAPRIARAVGVGRAVAIGAVLFPAPIAVVAVAHGSVWLCASAVALAEFLGGIGLMLFDVTLNSLQTAVIHDAVRSRVSGAYSTVNYGIRPLGALVGGALASTIGLRPTLLTAAVGGAMSALWLLASPVVRIRSLDS